MNQRGNNPMGTIVNIRVSEIERNTVESYAAHHGLTISEAIREILERHVKENSK